MPDLNLDQFGDYHMRHRPSDEWGRFHEADQAYPGIYERPRTYFQEPGSAESMRHILRAKGDPNARVPMYRAVPGHVHQINPGDWVSASRTYAQQHLESEGGDGWHVLQRQAKAHELSHSSDSINELGYIGEHPRFANSEEGNKAADAYWKAQGK
jgi:hypothetical protein